MAMRGCLFAIQEGNLPEYAKNVFMSYWSKGLDISNLTILLDIATSSGMDPQKSLKTLLNLAKQKIL